MKDRERGVQSICSHSANGTNFSDRIKSMEQQITSKYSSIVHKKPKDLLRAIGKIDSSDWQIREIEKKMQQSKKTEVSIKSKEKVPKWSKEQFVDRQVKMSKVTNEQNEGVNKKFKEIDETLKNLDKQLKGGSFLEVGERGKNKVASIAGQFGKKEDSSDEKQVSKTNPRVPLMFSKQTSSEKCHFCKQTVYLMEKVSTEGLTLHRSCLRCYHCHTNLRLGAYAFDRDDPDGRFYCTQHFKLPTKAVRPVIRKSKVKKCLNDHTKRDDSISGRPETILQLTLLDRGETPERIEFENADAVLDGKPYLANIMDENEWTDRNFISDNDDLVSELSSSEETDEESESFEDQAEGSPIAQTLQLATDWIGKQRYMNESEDSDIDFYDSSEGMIDDDADSQTEGEQFKRAREIRRQEVKLLPLPVNLPTDTETEALTNADTQINNNSNDLNIHNNNYNNNNKDNYNYEGNNVNSENNSNSSNNKIDIANFEKNLTNHVTNHLDNIRTSGIQTNKNDSVIYKQEDEYDFQFNKTKSLKDEVKSIFYNDNINTHIDKVNENGKSNANFTYKTEKDKIESLSESTENAFENFSELVGMNCAKNNTLLKSVQNTKSFSYYSKVNNDHNNSLTGKFHFNDIGKLKEGIENLEKENLIKNDIKKKLCLKEKWLNDFNANVALIQYKKHEQETKKIVSSSTKPSKIDEIKMELARPSEHKKKNEETIRCKLDEIRREIQEEKLKTNEKIKIGEIKEHQNNLGFDSSNLVSVNEKSKHMNIESKLVCTDNNNYNENERYFDFQTLQKKFNNSKYNPDIGLSLYDNEIRFSPSKERKMNTTLKKIENQNFSDTLGAIASQIVEPKLSKQASLDLSKFFPSQKTNDKVKLKISKQPQKPLKDIDLNKYFPQSPALQRKSISNANIYTGGFHKSETEKNISVLYKPTIKEKVAQSSTTTIFLNEGLNLLLSKPKVKINCPQQLTAKDKLNLHLNQNFEVSTNNHTENATSKIAESTIKLKANILHYMPTLMSEPSDDKCKADFNLYHNQLDGTIDIVNGDSRQKNQVNKKLIKYGTKCNSKKAKIQLKVCKEGIKHVKQSSKENSNKSKCNIGTLKFSDYEGILNEILNDENNTRTPRLEYQKLFQEKSPIEDLSEKIETLFETPYIVFKQPIQENSLSIKEIVKNQKQDNWVEENGFIDTGKMNFENELRMKNDEKVNSFSNLRTQSSHSLNTASACLSNKFNDVEKSIDYLESEWKNEASIFLQNKREVFFSKNKEIADKVNSSPKSLKFNSKNHNKILNSQYISNVEKKEQVKRRLSDQTISCNMSENDLNNITVDQIFNEIVDELKLSRTNVKDSVCDELITLSEKTKNQKENKLNKILPKQYLPVNWSSKLKRNEEVVEEKNGSKEEKVNSFLHNMKTEINIIQDYKFLHCDDYNNKNNIQMQKGSPITEKETEKTLSIIEIKSNISALPLLLPQPPNIISKENLEKIDYQKFSNAKSLADIICQTAGKCSTNTLRKVSDPKEKFLFENEPLKFQIMDKKKPAKNSIGESNNNLDKKIKLPELTETMSDSLSNISKEALDKSSRSPSPSLISQLKKDPTRSSDSIEKLFSQFSDDMFVNVEFNSDDELTFITPCSILTTVGQQNKNENIDKTFDSLFAETITLPNDLDNFNSTTKKESEIKGKGLNITKLDELQLTDGTTIKFCPFSVKNMQKKSYVKEQRNYVQLSEEPIKNFENNNVFFKNSSQNERNQTLCENRLKISATIQTDFPLTNLSNDKKEETRKSGNQSMGYETDLFTPKGDGNWRTIENLENDGIVALHKGDEAYTNQNHDQIHNRLHKQILQKSRTSSMSQTTISKDNFHESALSKSSDNKTSQISLLDLKDTLSNIENNSVCNLNFHKYEQNRDVLHFSDSIKTTITEAKHLTEKKFLSTDSLDKKSFWSPIENEKKINESQINKSKSLSPRLIDITDSRLPLKPQKKSSNDLSIDKVTQLLLERSQWLREKKRDFMDEKKSGNNPYMKKMILTNKSHHEIRHADSNEEEYMETYRPTRLFFSTSIRSSSRARCFNSNYIPGKTTYTNSSNNPTTTSYIPNTSTFNTSSSFNYPSYNSVEDYYNCRLLDQRRSRYSSPLNSSLVGYDNTSRRLCRRFYNSLSRRKDPLKNASRIS